MRIRAKHAISDRAPSYRCSPPAGRLKFLMKAIVIALLMGTVDAEQLRVTVYDKANVLDQVGMTVVFSLRRIFHQSGIDIEWVTGVKDAPESSLMIYQSLRTGHELEAGCRARRDIALDILPAAGPKVRKQVLGM